MANQLPVAGVQLLAMLPYVRPLATSCALDVAKYSHGDMGSIRCMGGGENATSHIGVLGAGAPERIRRGSRECCADGAVGVGTGGVRGWGVHARAERSAGKVRAPLRSTERAESAVESAG